MVALETSATREALQAFMDAITESALLMAADGTLLAVNSTAAERLQINSQQAIGQSIYSIIPMDVAQRRRGHVEEAVRRGSKSQFIDERQGRVIENNIYPVQDETGAVTRLAIVGVDITERTRVHEQLRSSEQRLREILDNIPTPVAVNSLDSPARIIYLNRRFVQTYGYTTDDIPTTEEWSLRAYPDPDTRADAMREWFQEVETAKRTNNAIAPRERRVCCKDGKSRVVLIGGNLIGDMLIVSLVDISERKELEETLAERGAFLEAVLGNIDARIYMKDRQGHILFANQKVLDDFHVTRENCIGHEVPEFLPKAIADAFQAMDEQVFQTQRTHAGEEHLENRDGRIRDYWTVKVPLTLASGKEVLLGLSTDITELRQLQKRLDRQLVTDELNGLLNRISFHERTSQALEDAASQRHSTGFILIGLDRFQLINDTLGHSRGDLVLVECAKRIESCLPTKAPLARLSGDQFAVLLVNLNGASEAAAVAELILQKLSASMRVAEEEVVITASIGIALAPIDGRSAELLIQNAEAAMYHSKGRLRGTYEFFAQEFGRSITARMELERDLRGALRHGQFQLHYQPIVKASDDTISKVEALIRWRHPGKGVISPDAFVPLAEDIGLIEPIGEWVIGEACSQLLRWKAEGFANLVLSINVSAIQLRSPQFSRRLTEIVRQFHLHPESLELEITESVVMSDPDVQIGQLQELAARGFQVSIDDFGTGYSSLAYIQKLPVKALKIDRSFVSGIEGLPARASLCRAIIGLAHSLDLKTIAEGIETDAQRHQLTSWGCDYLQGYLFSEPVSADEFRSQLDMKRGGIAPSS